jgi:hypothetical protein
MFFDVIFKRQSEYDALKKQLQEREDALNIAHQTVARLDAEREVLTKERDTWKAKAQKKKLP